MSGGDRDGDEPSSAGGAEAGRERKAVEAIKQRPRDVDGGTYFRQKGRKVKEQFAEAAQGRTEGSQLFRGVVIYVNGYTRPSARELEALVFRHGGQAEKFDSSRITHIVANVLPSAKITKILEMKSVMRKPVVNPQWVLDCVAKGRLVSTTDYLLKQLAQKNTVSTFFSRNKGVPETDKIAPNTNLTSNNKASLSKRNEGNDESGIDKKSGERLPLFGKTRVNWDEIFREIGIPRAKMPIRSSTLSFGLLPSKKQPVQSGSSVQRLYDRHLISHFIPFNASPLQNRDRSSEIDLRTVVYIVCDGPLAATGHHQYMRVFYETLLAFCEDVTVIGEYEAFLSFPAKILSSGVEKIRDNLENRIPLRFRFGVANNRILAFMCSTSRSKGEDDGNSIRQASSSGFSTTQTVSELPSVGAFAIEKLRTLGASSCADVLAYKEKLRQYFGEEEFAILLANAQGKDACESLPSDDPSSANIESLLDDSWLQDTLSLPLPGSIYSNKDERMEPPNTSLELKENARARGDTDGKFREIHKKFSAVGQKKSWTPLPKFHELSKEVVRELPKHIRIELAEWYKKVHKTSKNPLTMKPNTKKPTSSTNTATKKRWRAPSYEELDPSCIQELPPHIRMEIEKQRLRPQRPRKKLGSMDAYLRRKPKVRPLKRESQKGSIVSKRAHSQISLSQVDPATLEELPVDIRTELLRDLRRVNKGNSSSTRQKLSLPSERGKKQSVENSHLRAQEKVSSSLDNETKSLSLSQINPETLSKLSEDLRAEILENANEFRPRSGRDGTNRDFGGTKMWHPRNIRETRLRLRLLLESFTSEESVEILKAHINERLRHSANLSYTVMIMSVFRSIVAQLLKREYVTAFNSLLNEIQKHVKERFHAKLCINYVSGEVNR